MNEARRIRPEKQSIARELHETLAGNPFVILTDYKGMNVEQTAELRKRLRPLQTQFQVVKNAMLRQAATGTPYEDLGQGLEGPSAIIAGAGDMAEVARVIRQFAKEHELPVVKLGASEGAVLSAADVEHLATLPSRKEMQAMAVATLAAPMTQLAGVLQQKLSSLLYVLKAIEDKKQAA